ncbi:TIGR04255 family protein [Candidatus Lokiarchaeum ossiferum]|uniref:TIGR04255 family protein n=1 Tax=Candidatus Lokiarchaeum ossiferum TaxID=2951803 RepID=UPI00352D04B5
MEDSDYKVYKRNTVQQVIFQIRFSNLFLIENKIGDFQQKIMSKFPESKISLRKQLLLADYNSEIKNIQVSDTDGSIIKKIWSFHSDSSNESEYNLNILSDSMDISSKVHKSFYPYEGKEGFRDIIQFVMKAFIETIPIPKIKRMGLRYIDKAPIPENPATEFSNWYKTCLPIERFNFESIQYSEVRTQIEINECKLIFQERISEGRDNNPEYYLNFDAFCENIDPNDYIVSLDKLHKTDHQIWDDTFQEPVKKWMDNVNAE